MMMALSIDILNMKKALSRMAFLKAKIVFFIEALTPSGIYSWWSS